jgi:hypothetical protein
MSQKSSQRLAVARQLRIVLIATALAVVWSRTSPAIAQSGDMNCDGAFNIADIPLFVDALLAAGSFGGCDINRADMNADGLVDGRDTHAFVAALMTPTCPDGLTLCSGICISLNWDNANCGACGNQCPYNTSCIGGWCEPQEPCPGCGPP